MEMTPLCVGKVYIGNVSYPYYFSWGWRVYSSNKNNSVNYRPASERAQYSEKDGKFSINIKTNAWTLTYNIKICPSHSSVHAMLFFPVASQKHIFSAPFRCMTTISNVHMGVLPLKDVLSGI